MTLSENWHQGLLKGKGGQNKRMTTRLGGPKNWRNWHENNSAAGDDRISHDDNYSRKRPRSLSPSKDVGEERPHNHYNSHPSDTTTPHLPNRDQQHRYNRSNHYHSHRDNNNHHHRHQQQWRPRNYDDQRSTSESSARRDSNQLSKYQQEERQRLNRFERNGPRRTFDSSSRTDERRFSREHRPPPPPPHEKRQHQYNYDNRNFQRHDGTRYNRNGYREQRPQPRRSFEGSHNDSYYHQRQMPRHYNKDSRPRPRRDLERRNFSGPQQRNHRSFDRSYARMSGQGPNDSRRQEQKPLDSWQQHKSKLSNNDPRLQARRSELVSSTVDQTKSTPASPKITSSKPTVQKKVENDLSHQLVTDSEGGSTVSNPVHTAPVEKHDKGQEQNINVPSAIVTKLELEKEMNSQEKKSDMSEDDISKSDVDSNPDDTSKFETQVPKALENARDVYSEDSPSSSDDSDTDDEEVMMWASKMFGVPLQSPGSTSKNMREEQEQEETKLNGERQVKALQESSEEVIMVTDKSKAKKRKTAGKKRPAIEAVSGLETSSGEAVKKRKRGRPRKNPVTKMEPTVKAKREDKNEQIIETEEERMRKESAKPLTAAQIKAILGEDVPGSGGENWVRRSVRQPSKALLNSKSLVSLVDKLKSNHPDMVVLKMKKYVNDPNAPQMVINAALDALEENSNCQTLYIQNFNVGMCDEQVLHLLKILQQPKCKIWCLNIGETYNVKPKTWNKFTKGLKKTNITHMYASEHTVTTEMKDQIRTTIRKNRKKHDLHINPNNLDVIVQCTHCWWNPINAKVLQPYLKKQGFEHILNDKEKQGLRGTTSAAPTK